MDIGDVYVPPEIVREILSYRLSPTNERVNREFRRIEKDLDRDRFGFMDRLYPGWRDDEQDLRLDMLQKMVDRHDLDALIMMIKHNRNLGDEEFATQYAIRTKSPDAVQIFINNRYAVPQLIYNAIKFKDAFMMGMLMNQIKRQDLYTNALEELKNDKENAAIKWARGKLNLHI